MRHLKRIALFTTVGDDLNQAQSAACVKALKAYRGGSRDLLDWDDEAETQYNLIEELAIRLKRFNDRLAEEGLPRDVESLLARQAKDYETEAQAFNEGLSWVGRLLWAIGNGAQVAWSTSVATRGRERALIPTELPQAWRTVFIFAQYLISPTANNWQLLDMTLQRSIMLLPNLIPYTLSFWLDIYGTPSYTWGSAGGALALVFVAIILHEQRSIRDRRIFDNYLVSLASDNAVELAPQLPVPLQLEIDEIKEVQFIIDHVINSFPLGNATSGQHARMNTAANTLFRSTDTVIERRPVDKRPNVHRRAKYYVVGMGDALIAFTLAASARNPSVLVSNLRWAAFYHYKLQRSAENSSHKPEHTLELFCIAGAMMMFGLPLVSAVLLFGGRDFFEDDRRLFNHTAAMMSLQSTVVHHVGPAALNAPKLPGLVRRWLGGKDLTEATTETELTEDHLAALREELRSVADILRLSDATLEALDQRPAMPSLTEILEPFLTRLDEYDRRTKDDYEPLARSRGKAPDTATSGLASSAARGPADLVDLFSAMDIVNDTTFLQDRLQAEAVADFEDGADFAKLKSIMLEMTAPDPVFEEIMKLVDDVGQDI